MRSAAFLLALMSCAFAFGQPEFSPLGLGVGAGGLTRLEAHPDGEHLIIAGGFNLVEGQSCPRIVAWDGTEFEPLGCGLLNGVWDCTSPLTLGGGNPVTDLEFWNGELYACGVFSHSGSTPVHSIARWDGSSWQPVGGQPDESILSVRGYADGLYATGNFTHIDTLEALGLARWDGTTWHSVYAMPDLNPNYPISQVFDMAWYDDMLYVAGHFIGPYGDRISRWNGTVWEPVPPGFHGAFPWVYRLEVHNDLLYVAGAFTTLDDATNPGSGVVAYDGSNWYPLAGGTTGSVNNAVNEMLWWNDTLYIAGSFNVIGGVPSDGLAKWDGERWCSLVPPDYFNITSNVIGLFHDSLFIGGNFTVAGGDSIARIGRWEGGTYLDSCGLAVGVAEPTGILDISLFPNPARDHVMLGAWPSDARYVGIHDALGRSVRRESIPLTGRVELGTLAPGHYLLVLTNADGQHAARGQLVVQRQ
jgi:hypothetical protein